MNEDFELLIGVNTLHVPDEICERRGNYQVQHLYVEKIIESGGLPVIVPTLENKRMLAAYLNRIHAFVFIGGPDFPAECYAEKSHPQNQSNVRSRAACDVRLMKEALKSDLPILGICAGEQLMNIALGGKLIQHLDNAEKHVDEQYHNARILDDTILRTLTGTSTFEVNSCHHQAVQPEALGRDLMISAFADDGTVEAIEGIGDKFRLGLQFHIERHKNEMFSKSVFGLLMQKAKEYKDEHF